MTQYQEPNIGFINLGCANSIFDCEKIINSLFKAGYNIHDSGNDVFVVVVYCCGKIEQYLDELPAIQKEMPEGGRIIITGNTVNKINQNHLAENKYIILSNNEEELLICVKDLLPLGPLPEAKYSEHTDGNECETIRLTPPHYAYLPLSSSVSHLCSSLEYLQNLSENNELYTIDEVYSRAKILASSGVQEFLVVGALTEERENNYLVDICSKLTQFNIWIRLHDVFPINMINNIIPLMQYGDVLPVVTIALHENIDNSEVMQQLYSWRKIIPHLAVNVRVILDATLCSDKALNNLLDCLNVINAYNCVINIEDNAVITTNQEKQLNEKVNQVNTVQNRIAAEHSCDRVGGIEPVMIDDTIEYEGVNNIALARSVYDTLGAGGIIQVEDIYGAEPGQIVHVEIIEAVDENFIAIPA